MSRGNKAWTGVHTDACRKRIEGLMKEDEEDHQRIVDAEARRIAGGAEHSAEGVPVPAPDLQDAGPEGVQQ
eukprot:5894647-Karenia_brevis.AAC.1